MQSLSRCNPMLASISARLHDVAEGRAIVCVYMLLKQRLIVILGSAWTFAAQSCMSFCVVVQLISNYSRFHA